MFKHQTSVILHACEGSAELRPSKTTENSVKIYFYVVVTLHWDRPCLLGYVKSNRQTADLKKKVQIAKIKIKFG